MKQRDDQDDSSRGPGEAPATESRASDATGPGRPDSPRLTPSGELDEPNYATKDQNL